MAKDAKLDMGQVEALKKLFTRIKKKDLDSALYDAGQIILNSTHAGFMQQIDPDGEQWPENPEWYKEMKGGQTTLVGPLTNKIDDGPFAKKYKFKNVNRTRMRNELEVLVDSTKVETEVVYSEDAQERAQATQEGKDGVIELLEVETGNEWNIEVEIIPRVHLGISDSHSRVPGDTDVGHILTAFAEMIDIHLKKDLGIK
jgi:hypothetical protein